MLTRACFAAFIIFSQIGNLAAEENDQIHLDRLPQVGIRWRQGGEAVPRNEWIKSVGWVWAYPYEYNLVASPMIRVEVEVPRGTRGSERTEMIPTMLNPLKFIQNSDSTTVIVDVPLFTSRVNIEFDVGSERAVLEVRVPPTTDGLYIAIHPSCGQIGLNVEYRKIPNMVISSQPIAVTCLMTNTGKNLNIQHIADTKVESSWGKMLKGRFRHIIEYSDRDLQAVDQLHAPVKVCEKSDRCNGLVVSDTYFVGAESWSFNVIPYLGYSSYRQYKVKDVVHQLSAGLGIKVRHHFRNQRFNVEGGLATTLAPLSSDGGGNEKSSFHHFHIQAERLIHSNDTRRWAATLGYVLESMSTVGTGWGYDGLQGPSIGGGWRKVNTKNPIGIAGRLGFIRDHSADFDLRNISMDLMFSYHLFRRARGQTISLAPTLRYLHFDSSIQRNSVNVTTAEIGLDFRF